MKATYTTSDSAYVQKHHIGGLYKDARYKDSSIFMLVKLPNNYFSFLKLDGADYPFVGMFLSLDEADKMYKHDIEYVGEILLTRAGDVR